MTSPTMRAHFLWTVARIEPQQAHAVQDAAVNRLQARRAHPAAPGA
jgi:hypothetical protein